MRNETLGGEKVGKKKRKKKRRDKKEFGREVMSSAECQFIFHFS